MLHYSRLEKIATDKHFNLVGPLVSYRENKVLQIRFSSENSEIMNVCQFKAKFMVQGFAKKLNKRDFENVESDWVKFFS